MNNRIWKAHTCGGIYCPQVLCVLTLYQHIENFRLYVHFIRYVIIGPSVKPNTPDPNELYVLYAAPVSLTLA